MLKRITIGVIGCLLMGGLVLGLAHWRLDATVRAGSMAGHAWYSLKAGGAHIGYLFTNSGPDLEGRWEFHSDLAFSLDAQAPVRIRKRLVFAASPPHALIKASYWRTQADAPRQGVVWAADSQDGQLTYHHGAAVSQRTSEWRYELGDYLAVESWLAHEAPGPGEAREALALDLDLGRLERRQFQVQAHNETGYQLVSGAPMAATEIQLDARFMPVRFSLAGLFVLERTSRAEALAPWGEMRLPEVRVLLDRALPDHGRIGSLRLVWDGPSDLAEIWPEAQRQAGEWRLDAPLISSPNPDTFRQETLAYPVRHVAVQRLLREALPGAQTGPAALAQLVRFVHGHVAYRGDARPASVLETLRQRTGNCTELADLLTTLARANGWPARTISGVAYSAEPSPALVQHAWNEVFLEGAWRVVDSTWNQSRADAARLPLRPGAAQRLAEIVGRAPLQLRVAGYHYH